MLPHLPETRVRVGKFLMEFFKRQTFARTGVWQQVKRVAAYECSGFQQLRSDGSVDDQNLVPSGVAFQLDCRDIQREGFSAVLKAYDKAAAEMGQKMVEFNFARLREILEEAGQSHDAGGRPFTPDLLMDSLEKVEIDFDGNGMPCMQFVFPLTILRNWNMTDEQRRRYDQILEQKRLSWRDRESDRRLVD